jgi:cysteinyl-tRNA synthetase
MGLAGHGEPPRNGNDATPLADRTAAAGAPLSPAGRQLHDRFVAAVDDDLDTPRALRTAREALHAPIAADERRWLVLDMDFVLGLDLHRSVPNGGGRAAAADELPAGAEALLKARAHARADRNWAAADRLRDELRALGIEPIDRADGTSDWRRLP